MKIVAIAAAAVLLAIPATALALLEAVAGNAPRVKQSEWAEGVLDVVNLESRVYLVWVNGNENFFYRGDARALNEALRKYAAVKADERRLVLLPSREQAQSSGRELIKYNWQFHVPSGIYLAITKNKNAVLTAYLDAEKPRGPLDRKKAEQWVAGLDDDTFETREAASRELEKLGTAAKPLLREALKASTSPEARRRIEAVLAKLKGIDAGDLEIPPGLTVVTATDLIAEHLEGLKDADQTKCGLAISALSDLAPFSDKVVPALAGMLKKDKSEYARRIAAWSLGRIGVKARDVLPALKEGMNDPDENVRAAFRSAVEQIEQAKAEPEAEKEAKKRLAILKDIEELKKATKKQQDVGSQARRSRNRVVAGTGPGAVTMTSKVQLELVGRLARKPGGSVGHMTLHGEHALLVNEDGGLQMVDVSNPSAPQTTGSYRPKDSLGPVAASGDHAYVVEKDNRLRVLNVSDPAKPRAVGLSKFPDSIRGLAVIGKHAYVSMSDSMRVLDVSDPTLPNEVGVCGGLELAGLVTVAGKYAYVAADFNGMRIIDVSNPDRPKEIGSFEGPGNVTKVAIADKYAYLADYSGGLYIVDVSRPKKPRQVGRYGDFVVGDVAVAGNYALLAAGELDVIDVTTPDRPKQAGSFSQKDCDTAWSVAVAGDYVYSISDLGLFITRLTPQGALR